MQFNLNHSYAILERTPAVLKTLFAELPQEWILGNEGPETFSPFDVIGHLIQGEKTDWPDRIKMILEFGTSKTFIPFDRFAMYQDSKGKTLPILLDEFERQRSVNLQWLRSIQLKEADLSKKGNHPQLGEVTLKQLLSTWTVHDLTHIAQVTRVMAKQYKSEIGPWVAFFRILNF